MRTLIALIAALITTPALAREDGQWDATPPQIREWFRNLMQPDNPGFSCCGEADAYWADSFKVHGDQYMAVITDERADTPFGRPHLEVGTEVLIPNHKIKWDEGNPTGHGVLFINARHQVLCYVPPGGV